MSSLHILLLLIGPSACGKTSIAEYMKMSGIPTLVSYTTRRRRPEERDEREHIFISESEADALLGSNAPLAYTLFGGHRYFTLPSQLHFLLTISPVVSYVIDEAGYIELRQRFTPEGYPREYMFVEPKHWPKTLLIPIYISRPHALLPRANSKTMRQRLLRDSTRTPMSEADFALCINNNATQLAILKQWCKTFAKAVRIIPPDRLEQMRRSYLTEELETRTVNLAHIIAVLNGAIYHSDRDATRGSRTAWTQ